MSKRRKIETWIKASRSSGVQLPTDQELAEELEVSVSHVNHVKNNVDRPKGLRAYKKPSINSQRRYD